MSADLDLGRDLEDQSREISVQYHILTSHQIKLCPDGTEVDLEALP